MAIDTADRPAVTGDTSGIGGHPAGLTTLFFTEMWERFSYYGMRSLLVLFLIGDGGKKFGINDVGAVYIYGLYTSGVYLAGLPGGWIADRILGYRRAVFIGGVLIACGHFGLVLASPVSFALGLFLIVIGSGLLKPSVSIIVGDLYPEASARRDAGFSIFYMGITLGAFIGPLVCGFLGQKVNWKLGFATAGTGMVLGLIQYRLGFDRLGEAGVRKLDSAERRRAVALLLIGVMGLTLITTTIVLLNRAGALTLGYKRVIESIGFIAAATVVTYFGYHLLFGGFNAVEKKRIVVILILFIAATMFWCGFEQAGSSMNLFAQIYTKRVVFGVDFPASWLQSVNALLVIVLAPAFALVWMKLGDRQPSMPAKFALGLIQLGIGFAVLAWASAHLGDSSDPKKVGAGWLLATYFFHTTAELCISPVGLSSVTRLAPARLVGQMMGVWFVATSLGNLIAGLLAGTIETMGLFKLFAFIAGWTSVAGLLLLLVSGPIKRLLDR
jgi:POT family proton-dependent oligopeptide transporter